MEQDSTPQSRIPTNIADEMRQSYMDYAMSVIIGRALPDVRDGLKPANRRVLYGMQQMGLQPGRPYRKSAKIVGEVMGNYHPHGDQAIYDTLVRMAQPFNMRAPLVDGQGNFGSVDGDPPAAQRYTEARLTRLGASMMEDIEKETVDFQPTYDDSSVEPAVLPTVLPNLLVNGAAGIAVGMATNIPPHNLGEVVDAITFLLENQDLTPDERLEAVIARIHGPDFPTAGFIMGREGILQAYRTGRGSVVMRARAEIEVRKNDRESIVITEIPYQVNKARLIEKIADLARDERVRGIADVRDESDRQGMRVVVDVKKGEPAQVVLNNLYKHTPLQDTFGVIFLAIVDQRPRVLNLLDACELFVDFRRDVVRRRTAFELRKAEARAHVLEGYKIALDHLDEVIALIRAARSPEVAKQGLLARFALSEIQADEILKLQLQRLTGLERQKIVDELAELVLRIADLRDILASARRIDAIIGEELRQVRDTHADPRRTQIVGAANEIAVEDLIADEDVAISITHSGYIKRTSITSYRAQRRGGRGRMGMKTKDEDFVSNLFIASTHSYILIFTNRGRIYWLKVHEIPDVGPQGKGKAIVNLVQLQGGEKLAAFCAVRDFGSGGFVLLATRRGIVKKTELAAFSNPRPSGIIALSVEDGDQLIDAVLTSGEDELLIGTESGMAIHFSEKDARPMGRTAYGVKGIELDEGDAVVSLQVVRAGGTVLTVTRNGYGKRTTLDEYRIQSRGGKGLIDIKASDRNGPVVGVNFLRGEEQVMLITEKGMIIRLNTAEISTIGRNTQGVRLIQLEEGDHLVSVARLAEREDDDESLGDPAGGGPGASKEDP
jgi:DNA gyrase subunit A